MSSLLNPEINSFFDFHQILSSINFAHQSLQKSQNFERTIL